CARGFYYDYDETNWYFDVW
nr:immunoglobulin heavy chain junction region [Mus musculus]